MKDTISTCFCWIGRETKVYFSVQSWKPFNFPLSHILVTAKINNCGMKGTVHVLFTSWKKHYVRSRELLWRRKICKDYYYFITEKHSAIDESFKQMERGQISIHFNISKQQFSIMQVYTL